MTRDVCAFSREPGGPAESGPHEHTGAGDTEGEVARGTPREEGGDETEAGRGETATEGGESKGKLGLSWIWL